MITHSAGETAAMHQCRLDEQMAPEEYVGANVHPYPIPFSNDTQGTIESRSQCHATSHPTTITIHIRGIIPIGKVSSQFIAFDIEVFGSGDI